MADSDLKAGLEEVDFIIVGGGTAGCVIAARLADADHNASVLVIEGGPDNYENPNIIHPALYKVNFAPGSKTTYTYAPSNETLPGDRAISVAVGSVLGGSSSVNGAIYARPQHVDFDLWKTAGWSTNELVPFLERFEHFYPATTSSNHGREGPVAVSDGTYNGEALRDDFISAVNQTGYTKVEDLQDLDSNDAVSVAHRWVSPITGRRQDTAHTYIHPRLRDGKHRNLHVLVQHQVTRILIGGDRRATGVEVRRDPVFAKPGSRNATLTVKAKKLVVISAGALGTPQLLERSGIGSAQVLERAGVPIAAELPGVGNNLHDHQAVVTTYDSTLSPDESVDSVINGNILVAELLKSDARILSWNGVDASSKLRPGLADLAELSPAFWAVWDRDFADIPNKPLGSLVLVAGVLGADQYPAGRQYFSIGCYSPYPFSRGHIHITGPSIDDAPDFTTGYLNDPEGADLQTLVWLYKKQRRVVGKMKSALDVVSPEPAFASNETPARHDSAVEKWARENVSTAYHPLGTCKMAPLDEMGVVDPDLNVHGITGLKIADMSIPPENVSANLMSTALLIGEKAADIIIREYLD